MKLKKTVVALSVLMLVGPMSLAMAKGQGEPKCNDEKQVCRDQNGPNVELTRQRYGDQAAQKVQRRQESGGQKGEGQKGEGQKGKNQKDEGRKGKDQKNESRNGKDQRDEDQDEDQQDDGRKDEGRKGSGQEGSNILVPASSERTMKW